MRKMKGMTRWIASHHLMVNFRHFARHAPKGRVRTKVAARSAASSRGLWLGKSIRRYVAEGKGMVKSAATMAGHRYGGRGVWGRGKICIQVTRYLGM
jgi:hypothetical protein